MMAEPMIKVKNSEVSLFALQWRHMDYPLMYRRIELLEETKELIDSGWMGYGKNVIAIWKVRYYMKYPAVIR